MTFPRCFSGYFDIRFIMMTWTLLKEANKYRTIIPQRLIMITLTNWTHSTHHMSSYILKSGHVAKVAVASIHMQKWCLISPIEPMFQHTEMLIYSPPLHNGLLRWSYIHGELCVILHQWLIIKKIRMQVWLIALDFQFYSEVIRRTTMVYDTSQRIMHTFRTLMLL